MNTLAIELTKHAKVRIRQRAFQEDDIELLLNCASDIGDDAYLMMNQDIDREIRIMKHQIQRLEHLRGAKLVYTNGKIITVVRTGKKHRKHLLKSIK